MNLLKVPANSRIRVLEDARVPPAAPRVPSGLELNFHNLDGMYSFCTDDDGNTYHLAAWTDVEVIDDV